MDVIVLGIYNKEDVLLIEEVAIANDLKIVWDFEQYNIEAEIGIKDLEKYYKLLQTGILVDSKYFEGDTFYSYPIINEVSEYYISTEWDNRNHSVPRLFRFFDDLNKRNFQQIIIAFADEWNENTTVKIEKIKYSELKNRLNSIFVWCFGYRNFRTNSEVRDDFHPLVLELRK